ncbi:AAA ATPase domain protein [compost metagenome]
MSITGIRLEKFKKFKDLDIDLASPITLIYGENSSGKSSFIKAILSLIQTFSSQNKHQSWRAQGEYVDLGLYKDYINEHNIENKFSISVRSKPNATHLRNLTKTTRRSNKSKAIVEHKITYEIDNSTNQAKVNSFQQTAKLLNTEAGEDQKFLEEESTLVKLVRPKTRSYYHLKVDPKSIKSIFHSFGEDDFVRRAMAQANDVSRVTLEGNFDIKPLKEDESASPYGEDRLVLNMFTRSVDELSRLMNSFYYLGPLRMSPLRSYTLNFQGLSVGPSGAMTPLILSYLNQKASEDRTKGKIHKNRYERFQDWFRTIFPDYDVSVDSNEDVVRLKVVSKDRVDSIMDVGFGFSQVLPIIVQTAAMEPEDVLIIEQPELHLHPKAQVAFAKFLSSASKAGIRFIIETHSEHILKGLQLEVSNHEIDKNTGLNSRNIKSYYFHKSGKVSQMLLNKWGEIEGGWPEGFFDESYNISSSIVKNKIRSLRKENEQKTVEA